MVNIRKLHKEEIGLLHDMALRSFQQDCEKHSSYPPIIKMIINGVFPPLMFGKTILVDATIIGGAFVARIGKKGDIGAIFIDPLQQNKGYGKQAMLMVEEMYPNVKKWRLETPSDESFALHRFYESLGYVKTGDMKDKKGGIKGFVFEKAII